MPPGAVQSGTYERSIKWVIARKAAAAPKGGGQAGVRGRACRRADGAGPRRGNRLSPRVRGIGERVHVRAKLAALSSFSENELEKPSRRRRRARCCALRHQHPRKLGAKRCKQTAVIRASGDRERPVRGRYSLIVASLPTKGASERSEGERVCSAGEGHRARSCLQALGANTSVGRQRRQAREFSQRPCVSWVNPDRFSKVSDRKVALTRLDEDDAQGGVCIAVVWIRRDSPH